MIAQPELTKHIVSRFNKAQLEQWHERAAIYEYEGGLERPLAEHKAAVDVLTPNEEAQNDASPDRNASTDV